MTGVEKEEREKGGKGVLFGQAVSTNSVGVLNCSVSSRFS